MRVLYSSCLLIGLWEFAAAAPHQVYGRSEEKMIRPWTTQSTTTLVFKERMKGKMKEFLRRVFYGIEPTTVYTTLRPMLFPEEYDPIRVLDWQLREEKRLGITTPDWEPKLTDKTNLWDGYFNDPTVDDLTFWCQRHLHLNDSGPTTVKKYWDPTWGHERSLEELAKYWKREALKANAEWEKNLSSTKATLGLWDLTYDSDTKVRFSPNFGDSHFESEDIRQMTAMEKELDEQFEREQVPYKNTWPPSTL